MSTTDASSTKVVTGECRFSYLNAFVPRAAEEGGKLKYSVQLLIPKKDKETLAKVRAAIEAAKEKGKSMLVVDGKIPANIKICLRDGDIDRPSDESYAGHYFISANSNQKPGFIDENRQPILDANQAYSGMYGRADLNFYSYGPPKVKARGIACGLNNLQKLRDGEPLAGRASAEAAFGEDNSNDDL